MGVGPTRLSAQVFETCVSTNSTTWPYAINSIKNETCVISVVTHIKTHRWYHDIPTIRAQPSIFTYIHQSSFLPANLGDCCIIGPNLGFHYDEICATCVVTHTKTNSWLHDMPTLRINWIIIFTTIFLTSSQTIFCEYAISGPTWYFISRDVWSRTKTTETQIHR